MKTLLITGAGKGIGLEFVRQYAVEGWSVIATARKVSRELSDLSTVHKNIQLLEVDVTSRESIQKLKESIGSQSIDLLINNAAMFTTSQFGSINYDEFRKTLDTNTLAPLHFAETFVNNIASSEDKIIINMTGHLGSLDFVSKHPDYFPGYYSYRASKTALNMITILLAEELRKKNIIVLALSPGWVNTDMGGADADLTPEEAVSFIQEFLQSVSLESSGKFYERGKELLW